MEIDIAQERFVAHGLIILARNYLDVYPYDHWSDKVTRVAHQGKGLQLCSSLWLLMEPTDLNPTRAPPVAPPCL